MIASRVKFRRFEKNLIIVHITVEPLYNEHPGITNDILQPSNSKMYGKGPQYNEPVITNTFSQFLDPRYQGSPEIVAGPS